MDKDDNDDALNRFKKLGERRYYDNLKTTVLWSSSKNKNNYGNKNNDEKFNNRPRKFGSNGDGNDYDDIEPTTMMPTTKPMSTHTTTANISKLREIEHQLENATEGIDMGHLIPLFAALGAILIILLLLYCCLNRLFCFENCGGCRWFEDDITKLDGAKDSDTESIKSDDVTDTEISNHFYKLLQKREKDRARRLEGRYTATDGEDTASDASSIAAQTTPHRPRRRYQKHNTISGSVGAINTGYTESVDSADNFPYDSSTSNKDFTYGSISGSLKETPSKISPAEETLLIHDDSEADAPFGNIKLSLRYDEEKGKMHVYIIQLKSVPISDVTNKPYTSQIRVVLLPGRNQRHRTKAKKGQQPYFQETFQFKRLDRTEVTHSGISIRLLGVDKSKREPVLLGERKLEFASVNTTGEPFWYVLNNPDGESTSRSTSDYAHGKIRFKQDPTSGQLVLSSSGSSHSQRSSSSPGAIAGYRRPELKIGIRYNQITGRLNIYIDRGRNFAIRPRKKPNTYVMILLMAGQGEQIAKTKTALKSKQINPTFDESFLFPIASFQLPYITAMISVYSKNLFEKQMIGWFSLGNRSSSEGTHTHWEKMKQVDGVIVSRWHSLLDP